MLKCKACESHNFVIVISINHKELYCYDCGAWIRKVGIKLFSLLVFRDIRIVFDKKEVLK